MNKRGISEVVTAILIILLVLGAVVIVWGVVMPMIREKSGEVETEAFGLIHPANLKITGLSQIEGFTRIDFSVQNNGDKDIESLVLVMYGTKGTSQIKDLSVDYPSKFPISPLESRSFKGISYKTKVIGYPITKIEVVPKIIKAGKEIILKASIKEKTVPSYQSQGSCYDSIMPCSLNEAECNSHPRCTWSEGGGRCSGSKQDSCNDLTVDDCGGWNSGISGCDWTDEEGGCFFNENHPACWSFEGDYEACVNIDYCYFDFFCDPKEYLGCWYDKQEDCENVNYCEWNEEWGGYCMEKNCWSNHNNKGDCDNDEACIWYGSENSGWCDNIINKCYNYDNYEDCSTDLDCYSDPINSYCNFKWESYKEDCSYYWEDPELCAAKGCSWQSSFCTGEVYCGQLDCGQYIYDEDGTRCEANGCIWGGKYNCYPTASKCEEYADFGCGIKEKGCYKSEYFDISECYDFKNEQADCEAAGCIYCSDASGCEI